MHMRVIPGLVLSLSLLTTAAEERVLVEAGAHAHRHAITTFPAPASFPHSGTLRSGSLSLPFQKNVRGEVVFIIPELKEQEQVYFEVVAGKPATAITAQREEGRIHLRSGERPIISYQGHPSELPRADIPPAIPARRLHPPGLYPAQTGGDG